MKASSDRIFSLPRELLLHCQSFYLQDCVQTLLSSGKKRIVASFINFNRDGRFISVGDERHQVLYDTIIILTLYFKEPFCLTFTKLHKGFMLKL